MANNIVLKAIGLNTSPSFLDPQATPSGSLLEASNIIIRRDSIVESRRGYPLYGTPFGTSSDVAKQLMLYKGRIIRHFSNKLQWDTLVDNALGQSIFDTFCGNYLEPVPGRRIRYIEANGNLYFTTSEGIHVISAATVKDFTTACPFIVPAGGIQALDLSLRLEVPVGGETGFLPQDSAVTYEVVWGYNDNNNNEILGTPSSPETIFNPLSNLELLDFNNLLLQLDNVANNSSCSSLLGLATYFSTLSLSGGASATDIYDNLLALASQLDTNILLADTHAVAPLQIGGASINGGIGTISFSSGNPANYFISGNNFELEGFTTATGTIDGTTTNTTTGAVTAQTVSTLVPTFTTTGNTHAGAQQVTQVTTVADVAGSLQSAYFTLSSADNTTNYYVWYNINNAGTNPSITGLTGIQVNAPLNASANAIAAATASAVNGFNGDFTAIPSTNVVTITNSAVGVSTGATAGNTGFTVITTVPGVDANIITSIASSTGIQVGTIVTDTGGAIPAFTYVTAIGIGTITISNNATASVTSDTLNFDAAINFLTTATGPVTFVNPTINSFNYGFIAPPAIPSLPPTDAQLVALQTYLQSIITQLQTEPSAIICPNSQTNFITPVQLTTSANVWVTFTIPPGVTANDFYQIYRSPIAQATGVQVLNTDIFPSQELQLVYEGFPTPAQLAAGTVTVLDITPAEFAGAFLYTNAVTGSGILQANNIPPFALDINLYKNCVFYANTSTLYGSPINLLGVEQMIAEANAGGHPSITITNGVETETFFFVVGKPEITNITTVADVAGSLAGKYFTLNSALNNNQYYFWYIVSGVGVDPAPIGLTGIPINITTGSSAATVAAITNNVINSLILDFTSTVLSNVITVTTVGEGVTTDGTAATSGFTVTVTQQGAGANASLNQVLLSNSISPAQAVDQTAQSLVNIINLQPNPFVVAFYLSSVNGVPGQIQLQGTAMGQPAFYIVGSDGSVGASFSPNISPTFTISSNTATNPTVITTTTPNGFTDNEQVVISGSNSTPSIDGLYTITYISPTSFSIPVDVTVAGTTGGVSSATNTLTATNLQKPNRIYYSKILQPAAVPLVNFIDVGAQDQPILRIFPLRDSLFVYKSDGLYRISGEVAPFNLALFDLSCILLAPDSLDVSNNLVYGWTTQGISSTSESGVNIISRPIDINILPLATPQYTNFLTATWGIGYESDNSYTAYTVSAFDDTYATIAYRYSTLTNTWTTFAKTDNCGVINQTNDRQYLGAGDTNFLEQERKNFDRTDYADREHVQEITATNLVSANIILQDITQASVGDVITQDQYMTTYNYNNLLSILDSDVSLISTITNISAANPTTITTLAPHGLTTGEFVNILNSNSTPSIDGLQTVTVTGANTFTIPVNVLVSGNLGIINTYYANLTIGSGVDPRMSLDTLIAKIATDINRLSQAGHDPGSAYTQYEAIGGSFTITNVTATSPTILTTATPNGLTTGRSVTIVGSNSTPSIDGVYQVTVLSPTTFSIPVNVTNNGMTAITNISVQQTTTISAISIADPTVITTTTPHKLLTGEVINITGSNSTPSANGPQTVTVLSPTTFSIPITVTVAGTTGSFISPSIVTSPGHGLITGQIIFISGSNSTPTINGMQVVTVIDDNHFIVPINVTVAGNTGEFITDMTYAVNNDDFLDIEASFNGMISTLNTDAGIALEVYQPITYDTLQEAIIIAVNQATKTITLNLVLPFLIGPITIFKAIPTMVEYTPQDMQDPVSLKHFSDVLLFFENKTFTNALVSFASDLLPGFQSVTVIGNGNGIFGYLGFPAPVNGKFNTPGFGYGFFGGNGNAAPFRTYVPRDAQRCRFLYVQFSSQTAREKWSLQGITIAGVNTQSTRAYR